MYPRRRVYRGSRPDMVMCSADVPPGQRVFARQNEKVEKKRNQTKPRQRKENTIHYIIYYIDKHIIYARFDCFLRGLENNAAAVKKRAFRYNIVSDKIIYGRLSCTLSRSLARSLSVSRRLYYIILLYYYVYASFILYYYNSTVLYSIPRKAVAAALFRPSDRICGRDEKEDLHRGERHKRPRVVDVTHNNKKRRGDCQPRPVRAHCCRVSELPAHGRRGKNTRIVAVV